MKSKVEIESRNVLKVVTKYNKFESDTTTLWLILTPYFAML